MQCNMWSLDLLGVCAERNGGYFCVLVLFLRVLVLFLRCFGLLLRCFLDACKSAKRGKGKEYLATSKKRAEC